MAESWPGGLWLLATEKFCWHRGSWRSGISSYWDFSLNLKLFKAAFPPWGWVNYVGHVPTNGKIDYFVPISLWEQHFKTCSENNICSPYVASAETGCCWFWLIQEVIHPGHCKLRLWSSRQNVQGNCYCSLNNRCDRHILKNHNVKHKVCWLAS